MPDLVVPALGESISEATIAKWLKKVGESIQQDEPVVDLETDKVSVQLPAPAKGVLAEQGFAEGTTVRVGQVIGRISEAVTATAPPTPTPTTGVSAAPATPPPTPTTAAAPPTAEPVAPRPQPEPSGGDGKEREVLSPARRRA